MTESRDDEEEITYLPQIEAIKGHRTMAFAELRRQGCSHTALGYDPDFDSYFCEICNIWAEQTCTDRRCTYCARRPAVPSLAHRH